ncbi:Vasoactive intestinal polypeptide receptor 2 [Oryzias melastigma]|uniref:Growth hormone-releasing hormone receptor n=1 Tax=Oryzias melastigma TaxID=30732 RepID=A0A834BQS4_ORYME|nr:Vasoactive intestinal polypeptide receptor 2 [Oryzias melastigma]
MSCCLGGFNRSLDEMRSFTHQLPLLLPFLILICTVRGRFPHCVLHWEMQRARGDCEAQLQQQTAAAGCPGEWNNVSCWPNAAVGEVLTLPCPSPFLLFFENNGNLSRNCTEKGWSTVYPDIRSACYSEITDQPKQLVFYKVVRVLSTVGHSLSLIALLTSTILICLFRRLHCMRNYIHLNLFVSFMLRAVAVLAKDTLLFSEVGCKATLVFFNYFVMANFFWLLVEGLYLHTLLLVVHTHAARLSIYMFIGWGIPFVFMVAWIISRVNLEDTSCWEINDNPVPDRLINWPIMASVIINFILFISIIRVLVQKLRCSEVGGNDQSQYRCGAALIQRSQRCAHSRPASTDTGCAPKKRAFLKSDVWIPDGWPSPRCCSSRCSESTTWCFSI